MDRIFRHIAACNNAELPGGRTPLIVSGRRVGWVDPAVLPHLVALGVVGSSTVEIEAARLQTIAKACADRGLWRWRDEAFDVRATPDGPVLGVIDRGALPGFGIRAVGVHLNALVRRGGALHLWVARRAQNKLLDPGKLDHLVAGGVPAGLTPDQALLKEAEEEAGVPEALLVHATPTAVIDYAMQRPECLRRDRLHCYDVELPASFVPEARDGEVEGFELWPIEDVLDRVRNTDDFKFNVNLVLIDLFQRHGLLGSTPELSTPANPP